MQNLEKEFKSLFNKYTNNIELINSNWNELELKYSSKNRYYHNLSHISELLKLYYKFEHQLIEKDVILFAIFYHDIIYDVKKNNNEEKSAELAKIRLQEINNLGASSRGMNRIEFLLFDASIGELNPLVGLNIQTEKNKLVYDYIVATKYHKIENNDTDLAYFLDFDMAILGKDWDNYLKYTVKIRKEYRIYPNILYRKGRKKALKHFLKTERIYKTDEFFNRFEVQARKNIQKELDVL